MLNNEEYQELKRTLLEMDPDQLLDVLRIDSALLLEIVENYDAMLIEDAGERLGGSDVPDREFMTRSNTNKREHIKR